MNAASAVWNSLLELLYPPKCLVCGAMGEPGLCAPCRVAFHPVQKPVCARCGIPAGGGLCRECRAGRVHYFAAARAAGHFDGVLRDAILRLKYAEKRGLGAPLGAYLAESLRAGLFEQEAWDCLIPVPLHPSRERARGFNQSALIAREAGRILGIPVAERVLYRARRTRPQVELRASERADNVRDAFAVRNPRAIAGKTALLVDDVLTSLHTADECARVLANAGAQAVYVVGVARGA